MIWDRVKARLAAKKMADGVPKVQILKSIGFADTTAESKPQTLNHPLVTEARAKLQAALLRKNPQIFDKLADKVDRGLDSDNGFVSHRFCEFVARAFGALDPERAGEGGSVVNLTQIVNLVDRARAERGIAESVDVDTKKGIEKTDIVSDGEQTSK